MSIGSLLASKTNSTKQVWQKEYDNLGSELATNPTLEAAKQVLTLSYNDLSTLCSHPPLSKPCDVELWII
jgi:hypothetical protein